MLINDGAKTSSSIAPEPGLAGFRVRLVLDIQGPGAAEGAGPHTGSTFKCRQVWRCADGQCTQELQSEDGLREA